jgi:hypothetical protein
MDPFMIYSAMTAIGDQQRRQTTATRRPSRHAPSNSTRPWRPGAARMLRRLADQLDAESG